MLRSSSAAGVSKHATPSCAQPAFCPPIRTLLLQPRGLHGRLQEAVHDSVRSGFFAVAEATLAEVRVPRAKGRPWQKPDRVIADRGYDSDPLRQRLRRRGIDLIVRPIARTIAIGATKTGANCGGTSAGGSWSAPTLGSGQFRRLLPAAFSWKLIVVEILVPCSRARPAPKCAACSRRGSCEYRRRNIPCASALR